MCGILHTIPTPFLTPRGMQMENILCFLCSTSFVIEERLVNSGCAPCVVCYCSLQGWADLCAIVRFKAGLICPPMHNHIARAQT